MISRYKINEQKYEKVVTYVDNHKNISENLKTDIKYVIEKYRIAIFCMEETEVYEWIEQCAKNGSTIPLEKQLHSIISVGSRTDSDAEMYNDESVSQNEPDEGYVLD